MADRALEYVLDRLARDDRAPILNRLDTGPERVEFDGMAAWFKHAGLRGRGRWRWTLRHWWGARLPRVAEFENLRWLRARLFEAPRPLAAGFVLRAGAPRWQFLITEDVPEVVTLEEFLDDRSHAAREHVLSEAAREIARLHALGFVHHDLYPRNVLVRGPAHGRRLVFLDAWAGGPPPRARSGAYDLACFLLRADSQLSRQELSAFLGLYVEQRAAQSRPVDAAQLCAAIGAFRGALVRRLASRPHETRGRGVPAVDLPLDSAPSTRA